MWNTHNSLHVLSLPEFCSLIISLKNVFGTITYFACKVGMYIHASGSIVKMNNKQSLPIVIEKEAPFDGRDGRRIRPLL